MKTVEGGDAGRGTGCAQQADRPQGNELLKLQAGWQDVQGVKLVRTAVSCRWKAEWREVDEGSWVLKTYQDIPGDTRNNEYTAQV